MEDFPIYEKNTSSSPGLSSMRLVSIVGISVNVFLSIISNMGFLVLKIIPGVRRVYVRYMGGKRGFGET